MICCSVVDKERYRYRTCTDCHLHGIRVYSLGTGWYDRQATQKRRGNLVVRRRWNTKVGPCFDPRGECEEGKVYSVLWCWYL